MRRWCKGRERRSTLVITLASLALLAAFSNLGAFTTAGAGYYAGSTTTCLLGSWLKVILSINGTSRTTLGEE